MIEVNNVYFGFGETLILKDLSCDFPKGKITTIIGPNGCGKSTLIKCISDIYKYKQGIITVDGVNRKDISRKDFARKVAFLMQFGSTISGMSVKDIVMYGRYPYKERFKSFKQEDYDIVEECLNKTDLTVLQDRDIITLSGGEKQRVWLAMCLAQKPEIIILDEPTNHLDLKYQYSFLKMIKKINIEDDITCIIVMHDINQASQFSDKIMIMNEGRIIHQGPPQECITKEIISEIYQVSAQIKKDNHTYIRIIEE